MVGDLICVECEHPILEGEPWQGDLEGGAAHVDCIEVPPDYDYNDEEEEPY